VKSSRSAGQDAGTTRAGAVNLTAELVRLRGFRALASSFDSSFVNVQHLSSCCVSFFTSCCLSCR